MFGLLALSDLQDHAEEERHLTSNLFDYVNTAGVKAGMGILVDPLSVFMVLVVTGVSSLIHLYSVAYMDSDEGYRRYFAYLNFFVFSMLVLVLAGNFVMLIVGWAFVGFASYALISFWYRRTTATQAGMKAFVINVVGDVALVLAAFLLLNDTGALEFEAVFRGAHDAYTVDDGTLVAACCLILVGAFAKSAQIPLHTWLPDAMEGPTPVSALIHAATMVTAGVYLIARMHPLFELAPTAADIGAIVGLLTLIMAGSIALVVTDLKRIIAYSTISQIGYMIVAVSTFAHVAGLYHLMTHAFFKALLFMGAGSVISAMGVGGDASIDKMGGFRKAMPFTFVTFMIGSLTLAAFPLTSGFFSKDAILAFDWERGGGYRIITVLGFLAALVTALYAFRIVFRVFFGDPVPEARELDAGPRAPRRAAQPLDRRARGHRRRLPRQRARDRRALVADEGRDVGAGGSLASRRARPAAGRDQDARALPAPDVRGLPVRASSCRRPAPSGPSALIGGIVSLAGIGLAYFIWVKRPGTTARLIDRLPRRARLPRAQVVLGRAVRLRRRPADGGVRQLRAHGHRVALRAGHDHRRRPSASCGRALRSPARSSPGYLRAYALLLLIGMFGLALYFLIVSS